MNKRKRFTTTTMFTLISLLTSNAALADCLSDQWNDVCANGQSITVTVRTGMTHDNALGHDRPLRNGDQFRGELYANGRTFYSTNTPTVAHTVPAGQEWQPSHMSQITFEFANPYPGTEFWFNFNGMGINRTLCLVENQESSVIFLKPSDTKGKDPRLLAGVSASGNIMDATQKAKARGWLPGITHLRKNVWKNNSGENSAFQ